VNRELKKEQAKLGLNLQDRIKSLEVKIQKNKDNIKSALETNKDLLEVNLKTRECLQTHKDDLNKPLHHLMKEIKTLNSQLENISDELNITDYVEDEQAVIRLSDNEEEDKEPLFKLTEHNEEDKTELKSPYIKEWIFSRPSVSKIPHSDTIKLSPKNTKPIVESNKKPNVKKTISFGEACYVHSKGKRVKKWLLVGEEGSLKISQSEEFKDAEIYKLQHVIKMSYGYVSFVE